MVTGVGVNKSSMSAMANKVVQSNNQQITWWPMLEHNYEWQLAKHINNIITWTDGTFH